MTNGHILEAINSTTIRNFRTTFVARLQTLSRLTKDGTYNEVYPVFEPIILSYNVKLKFDHSPFIEQLIN